MPGPTTPGATAGGGYFIAFEGGEGAGKSTQTRAVTINALNQCFYLAPRVFLAKKAGAQYTRIVHDQQIAGIQQTGENGELFAGKCSPVYQQQSAGRAFGSRMLGDERIR